MWRINLSKHACKLAKMPTPPNDDNNDNNNDNDDAYIYSLQVPIYDKFDNFIVLCKVNKERKSTSRYSDNFSNQYCSSILSPMDITNDEESALLFNYLLRARCWNLNLNNCTTRSTATVHFK